MTDEKKEARIHPWVYYIAPIGNKLYFGAFCKACRQYFAEEIPIPYHDEPGRFSPSTLPRYGCEPISEDVQSL